MHVYLSILFEKAMFGFSSSEVNSEALWDVASNIFSSLAILSYTQTSA